jgi:hypothetical protein
MNIMPPGVTPMAGACEQGNEALCYVNIQKFLDHLCEN